MSNELEEANKKEELKVDGKVGKWSAPITLLELEPKVEVKSRYKVIKVGKWNETN